MIYYLQKDGVYAHGLYWIGEDLEEGRRQADLHASLDRDDHHAWGIYEHLPSTEEVKPDEYPPDQLVYTGKRT